MLYIRHQHLEAFRPALEAQFIDALIEWAESAYPVSADEGRQAQEARVRAAYHRAKAYLMVSKRDVSRFVQFDLRLGADFDNAPGNEWMKTILSTRGLSVPTKLYRIECGLERVAAMAAARKEEEDGSPANNR